VGKTHQGTYNKVMQDLSYAREKLGLAVEALVSSKRDYWQRMLDAYEHWHVLVPENLPDDLADEIRHLREAVSWLPPPEEEPEKGRIIRTLQEMSAQEYDELARRVVSLFEKVVERKAAGL
jgi:hypothetical protein